MEELFNDDDMHLVESGEREKATARAQAMEILGLDAFDLEMPSFAQAALCKPAKCLDPLRQDKRACLAKAVAFVLTLASCSIIAEHKNVVVATCKIDSLVDMFQLSKPFQHF